LRESVAWDDLKEGRVKRMSVCCWKLKERNGKNEVIKQDVRRHEEPEVGLDRLCRKLEAALDHAGGGA